jgi:hypothetical protein
MMAERAGEIQTPNSNSNGELTTDEHRFLNGKNIQHSTFNIRHSTLNIGTSG